MTTNRFHDEDRTRVTILLLLALGVAILGYAPPGPDGAPLPTVPPLFTSDHPGAVCPVPGLHICAPSLFNQGSQH